MRTLLTLGITLAFVSAASADFFDDFESYADTAEMQAVWGSAGPGTLDTAFGNPGQSMWQEGLVTPMNVAAFPTMSDDPLGIVLEFDMYDDGTGNKRMGGRLNKTGWGWFDIGQYNDLGGLDGYGFREVGNAGQTWTVFPTIPAIRPGWHTFRVTATATDVTYECWLAEAGEIPAAYDVAVVARAAGPLEYADVQLGNFAAPSAGGGVWFDNVSVYQVPEPSALALLTLGGLTLIRRR